MSDAERTQLDRDLMTQVAKLPEELKAKLLDQASGAAMAIDLLKKREQEEEKSA